MGSRTWKALLWKAFREERILVAILFLLPPLVFLVAHTLPQWRYTVAPVGIVVFAVAIAALAVYKVPSKDRPNFSRIHLPLPFVAGWVLQFIAPLVVCLLAGAWFGLWSLFLYDSLPVLRALAGAIGAGAAFCTSYVLGSATTWWLGIVAGVFIGLTVRMETYPKEWRFVLYWLAVAVAGALLYDLVGRNWPGRIRRAAAVGVPAILLGIVLINGTVAVSVDYYAPRIDSSDWSRYVTPIKSNGGRITILEFGNYRTDNTARHEFENIVVPVDFAGHDRVYIAQQRAGEKVIRVLLWNTSSGTVDEVLTIPSGPVALVPVRGFPRGFVRPDERYMLLAVRSQVGQGRDLWVVDLKTRLATIALVNSIFASGNVQWVGDRALLSGFGSPVRIDLTAAVAERINLPLKAGG